MHRLSLTTLFLATSLALIVAACSGGDVSSFDADRRGGDAASTGDGGAAPAAERNAGEPGGPAADALASERKIIFTASLSLRAEDVRAAFASVEGAARAAAGYVERSSIGTNRGSDGVDRAVASITIRVPAERYDETLNSLRTIGGTEVAGEESASTEVTEEYTDLESRLRNLERSELRYLDLLGEARTISDILVVNERIDAVRSQIEQIQGRLRLLDDLSDLATIAVTISTHGGDLGPDDDGPKPFLEALRDAWNGSLDAAGHVVAAAAVALVAAAWLALPALALVGLAWRARRRWRSGGAIDPRIDEAPAG